MSQAKKLLRARFNESTLRRDQYRCRLCPSPTPKSDQVKLEVHHITDRNLMPNGGYVKENGVSLCPYHHLQAEANEPAPGELYNLIGSSYGIAVRASQRLHRDG